jgi:hypothetical protein
MFSSSSLKILPFKRYVEKYGTAGQATDGNTIRRTRIACCVTKATNTNTNTHTHTHTEYVILLHFLRPKQLRERASMLRYTCTACFIYINSQ